MANGGHGGVAGVTHLWEEFAVWAYRPAVYTLVTVFGAWAIICRYREWRAGRGRRAGNK